ncbi:MAG TPA: GDP-mannose 4,6-dehydratase, partial [Syntrophobacteraceae bacterium]|nr:GDP-mannose 4,6-dehydratase [Syntrophobacteraceae bacterium]
MGETTEKKAAVVTGVAGFVGSHLASRLLELGFGVVGVDNLFSGKLENIRSMQGRPGFSFYRRSVTEPGLLPQLKAEHPHLNYCFHLAAIVSVPYSLDHPQETM